MQSNITLDITLATPEGVRGVGGVRRKWLLMTWDWVFWVFIGISSCLTLDDKKGMHGFCSGDKGCSSRGVGGGGDHMGY